MTHSQKIRLYPSPVQEELIEQNFNCGRLVWNYYLAEWKEAYQRSGMRMDFCACARNLTWLKKDDVKLRRADARALEHSLSHLSNRLQRFFRQVDQGLKPAFPPFKEPDQYPKLYKTQGCIHVSD